MIDHGLRRAMADEEYECDCGATFETEAELKQHAREVHDADVW